MLRPASRVTIVLVEISWVRVRVDLEFSQKINPKSNPKPNPKPNLTLTLTRGNSTRTRTYKFLSPDNCHLRGTALHCTILYLLYYILLIKLTSGCRQWCCDNFGETRCALNTSRTQAPSNKCLSRMLLVVTWPADCWPRRTACRNNHWGFSDGLLGKETAVKTLERERKKSFDGVHETLWKAEGSLLSQRY